MLDQLRDQIATYLANHHVCVICTVGAQGASAMPARYRNHRLEVDCLIPRWAEVAYHLQENARTVLVIVDEASDGARWLEVLGCARVLASPAWNGLLPDSVRRSVPLGDLYLVVRVTPQRIDMFDESKGWGARETVEL